METDEKGILTDNELDGYGAYDAAISQHQADIEAVKAVENPQWSEAYIDYFEAARSLFLAALKAEEK